MQMKVNSLLIATGAAILITAIGFSYFYDEAYLNIFLPSYEISLIKGGKALAFGYYPGVCISLRILRNSLFLSDINLMTQTYLPSLEHGGDEKTLCFVYN